MEELLISSQILETNMFEKYIIYYLSNKDVEINM